MSTRRACSTEQPGTIRPNLFSRLPPELWLDILDLLPLPSAASLAYTCRHMHIHFGQKSYSELRLPQNKSQKFEFLSYLDPGLPRLRLCLPCAVLHTRKSLKDEQQDVIDADRWWFSECSCELGFLRVALDYTLNWPSIQLVMRAYHQSPEHGIPLGSLERRWENGVWSHHTEPLILNGKLLMKTQSTKLVELDMDMKHHDFHDLQILLASECHRYLCNRMQLLACALGHIWSGFSEVSTCDFCRKLWRCRGCYTEYRVEIRKPDEALNIFTRKRELKKATGWNLILTEWKDLGEGKSPLSSEWRCATFFPDKRWTVRARVPGPVDSGNLRT